MRNRPVRRKLKIVSSDIDPNSIYIPGGSDIRITGGFMGECALCDKQEQLRLSHIIPRWMYKWARAEGVMVGDYRTLGITTAEQDGRKHYLLCDSCEQFLGIAENYVSILQDEDRATERAISGLQFLDNSMILGIDYKLVLRFLTSIAFKANLVDSAPYHNINLSKAFEFDCKRFLLGLPQCQQFTIFAMRFHSALAKGVDPRAMVYVHRGYYRGMGEGFTVLGGGWEWNLIRHKNSLAEWPPLYREIVFIEDKPSKVMWGEIMDHRFLPHNRGSS